MSMAASSYHHPQFSEDITWLPAWLQPHQVPFSSKQIEDSPIVSPATFKDVPFLQEKVISRQQDFISEGDARYSGCHLFLSGDDHSPIGNTPSSGIVPHFHLHLSSSGISQNTSSQSHDTCQTERLESSKVLCTQPTLEKSLCLDDTDGRASTEDVIVQTCLPKAPHRSSSPTKDNSKSGKKLQEKFDSGRLQNTDIHDAIELSIAASEALAISELVKGDPPSEVFPAGAILEIALRVKQARSQYHLDELGYEPLQATYDFDETDWLSDLDENTMAGAFEDVGLPVTQVTTSRDDFCGNQRSPVKNQDNNCSSLIKHEHSSHTNASHVLNMGDSRSQCECNGKDKKREIGSQVVDFSSRPCQGKLADAFPMELRLKELSAEYPETAQMEACSGGPFSSTSNLDSHLNVGLHPPVQTTVGALATTEIPSKEDGMIPKVVNSGVGVTFFQSQASEVSSPCIADSRKADVVNAVNDAARLTTERFRSRWFGGWTVKDAEIPIRSGQNNIKIISKFFIKETSFLSESMDVVTDENSVQKLDTGPERVTLSCTPHASIPQHTNEGIFLSQDVVGSSNFSMSDPLCSVVPCSLSLEKDHTIQASSQKKLEKEAGKGLNVIMDHVESETIQLMSPGHKEENVASKTSSEGFATTTRKQLTSLRMYSMVEPAHCASVGGEFSYFNESVPWVGPTDSYTWLLSSKKNVDCLISLNKGDSAVQLRGKPTEMKMPGYVSYRSNSTTPVEGPILESTVQNITEMINDEVQVRRCEQSFSPLVLNYGSRRRLRACDIIVTDSEEGIKKSLKLCRRKTGIDESGTDLNCMDQTKSKSCALPISSQLLHPQEKLRVENKRVRFTEPEVQDHPGKTIEKPSSVHQTRSRHESCERRKPSRLGSMFGTGKENYSCLKGCGIQCRKGMLFHSLEFLLTGFSRKKEKELEMLIRKHGGVVLPDVPSPPSNLRGNRQSGHKHQVLPVLLSPKKVQTAKFLYGCAIDTFLLKHNWLSDSLLSGSLLSPDKYLILPNQASNRKNTRIGQKIRSKHPRIFDAVGIMFYGKPAFCSKFGKIVKHGCGHLFKTLHLLVQSLKNRKISMGVIVFEDESGASRHLRHCASEQKLQLMPASWIINSLHMGKLLPFKKNDGAAPLRNVRRLEFPSVMDSSEEI